jgi:N-methylhydantoinase A
LHACSLAEELGIRTVLVPASAGVLSALGLVASDERRDRVESRLVPLDEAGELPQAGEADLRYVGQSFELTIPLQPDLAAAFHRAHEDRYGYADRRRAIELVSVRTADVRPGPAFDFPRAEALTVRGPAVLEQSGSTVFVPPGWVGVRDGSSTLKVTKP